MFQPVRAGLADRRLSDDEAVRLGDVLNQLDAILDGCERLSPDLVSPFRAHQDAARRRLRELQGFAADLAETAQELGLRFHNLI